ncbi:DNA methyltransferase, partial [Roseiflexus sp.]
MKFDVDAVRNCLKSFDFQTLFREHLGWDNHNQRLEVAVGDQTYALTAVAQKRGFVAFTCPTIPDRATRLKIDNHVTRSAREHFVIYVDRPGGQQVWHWVRREPGKPLASRDHRFYVSQSGDPLIQRLNQIAVSLDEEERITVVDVAGRARAAFDVDRVTRRFYDRFKAEHEAFRKLIQGITSDADLQWYTSLMLNRLMFVYFIQKKGFLDGDTDYLRNRLAQVQAIRGSNKFHSFYRYFLLRLFHEGLGKSPDERALDPTFEKLLGNVPFLDGGFFEVHDLEARWPEIDIPDAAFEKLFDFFDQYAWHLDERPLRADNEINPDVVGYIFEKYINQKQMGAYYTKEDITEYISKNTIIPFIFDAASKVCAVAFRPDSSLWRLLRDDPDRYIYPAVRHGVVRADGSIVPESDLPDFVQKGMHDPKARMHDRRYNLEQAPGGDLLRLATETWREYVYRRNRCLEIREKLRNGEVHQINDLITLNLDIWQFARDAIVQCEGPELLRAFWHAIENITVLDPTCGSGAFLFAALRILETLYSDCLERMERFVEDLQGKKHHPEQFSDFKRVLEQIGKHPNERYFILKSIIINNLYGVDIMEEAVEICKLRLFLKLVAQVERVEQIEPLPDIDFNIRAGNTLVGYATA